MRAELRKLETDIIKTKKRLSNNQNSLNTVRNTSGSNESFANEK